MDVWWRTPVLTGIFALIGVLIAQCVVLYLALRAERRRADPELLKHCAAFAAAAGHVYRTQTRAFSRRDQDELDLTPVLDQLETAWDSISIVATPGIESAASTVMEHVAVATGREVTRADREIARRLLASSHDDFVNAVRRHLKKGSRVSYALPMIGTVSSRVPEGPKRDG